MCRRLENFDVRKRCVLTSTKSAKADMQMACGLYRTPDLKRDALWHWQVQESLLGRNDGLLATRWHKIRVSGAGL